MEMTESLSEVVLCRIRQCANERKQYLPRFRLWLECCSSCHDHLHVEVAHLERNTPKYGDIPTEAITGHREDGIPQLFKKEFAFVIMCTPFLVHILPPEVFFCIGITKEHHPPCRVIHPFAKVCGIDDEMNWSGAMRFLWNDNCIDVCNECLLVVSG